AGSRASGTCGRPARTAPRPTRAACRRAARGRGEARSSPQHPCLAAAPPFVEVAHRREPRAALEPVVEREAEKLEVVFALEVVRMEDQRRDAVRLGRGVDELADGLARERDV